MELFEALGFERRHTITVQTADGKDTTSYRLKNAGGFYVDVAQNERVPRDMTLIRMNVRDFDEAFDFLTARGFKNMSGNIVETPTNKSAMMTSPSGYAFDLCQHIRK